MTDGRRFVLVVDDDGEVRRVLRRILQLNDYDVQECASGGAAWALVKRGLSPDLVITDVVMPGMAGDELVRLIRTIHPTQKVLFVTGRSDQILALPPDLRGAEFFLDKPFTPKSLLAAVSQQLTQPLDDSVAAHESAVQSTAPASQRPREVSAPSTVINIVTVDAPALVEQLQRMLPATEFLVRAAAGNETSTPATKHRTDVIVLDGRGLRPKTLDLCKQLKRSEQGTPILVLTGSLDRPHRSRAVEAGADDFIIDPIDAVEVCARLRTLARLKRSLLDNEATEHALLQLALKVEARDPFTNGHCERLAQYATAIGKALKLSSDEIDALRRGAYLHDIGNLIVPEAVLLKASPLTKEEMSLIRRHPIVGDELCSPIPTLAAVRPIVRHHHERRDGFGYPDGLRGDGIPLLAEIMGVADAFDALTITRAHQGALSVEDATAILRDQARRGWRRRDLVELLVQHLMSGRNTMAC